MIRHIGEAAAIHACPSCRRHTLLASDGGLAVRADLEHLSVNGEITALIQNRATFDVLIYGLPRRMHLEFRDLDRIRAGRRHPVIADHQCGNLLTQFTEPYDDTRTEIVMSYRKPLPDVPPF